MNENKEVLDRLDLIMKLLAINIFSDTDTQTDKIIRLHSMKMKPNEIAQILGTTSNSVTSILSRARKKGEIK